MAGYTNVDFRRVLANCGAKVLYTEMVSAAAIWYGNKKTLKLLERVDAPNVTQVVQLFGHVPEQFKNAITNGCLLGFDEININMGCPANKVVKNSDGVALMSSPDLAREIIETCVKAAKVPVTVKMRLGKSPDATASSYVAFAKMCEMAGAKKLIVHGRYGSQGYSGVADWNAIAEIVSAVKIPVIANGDIKSLESAQQCLEITKASGVMVGRALLRIYKKYFPNKLQILRGEKIANALGVDPNLDSVIRIFGGGGRSAEGTD